MARQVPLRELAWARSGDKGDISNIGVMAKTPAAYEILKRHLTADVVKTHFDGIVKGDVVRYELDNLHSLEFVMRNALGGGATRTLMMDQTGKAFGPNLLRLMLNVED
jgi:phosphoribosylaminoimidazole-succinocarboxamide synthase